MRSTTAVLTVLLVLAAGALAREKPLAQLISEANAASLKSQPKLYTKIAQRQLKNADRLYRKGQIADAHAAVKDVATYCGKASEAAISSGKDLKRTEIAIRKMADRLRDIKLNLAFNERQSLQDAIDKLESMRTQLLTRMFSKGKK
jgi:chloramphenicol 3-O-phosphotransferase